MKRRLFLWVYPPFLLTVIAMLIALISFTYNTATSFFYKLSSSELKETVLLATNAISPFLLRPGTVSSAENAAQLQSLCKALAAGTKVRLTVISVEGQVLADTEADSIKMDSHADREEVIAAIKSGTGTAVRKSLTTGILTIYQANVLKNSDDQIIAIIRAAMPFLVIDSPRSDLISKLVAFGLLLLLLVSVFAIALTARLVAPILRIHNSARSFSARNWNGRIPEEGPLEIANLASVMNRMADDLQGQLRLIRDQKNQVEAVLNGMSEAVAVVDKELTVHRSNMSFKTLFPSIDSPSLLSRTRSTELCDFILSVIETNEAMETGLTIFSETQKQLLLTASPLEGGKAILVVSDLTRLNRLETVRRDFTANVSHELKTPITSIKAALETIQDTTNIDPTQFRSFVDIAVRATKRLEDIIEDLMCLSRIEEEEKKGIAFKRVNLDGLIDSLISETIRKSESQQIRLEKTGRTGLFVSGHEGLIRQALSNLLDNAVKYAGDFGPIQVSCSVEGNSAVISVQDQGPGIPLKDRSRLFERFYRVDKARSRDSGGTGLGLSIVKHIAAAHSGSVRLDSREGEGSTFSILFPLNL